MKRYAWRDNEIAFINDVIRNRKLSLFSGKYTELAENTLNKFYPNRISLILNSGTAALIMSLKLSGVKLGDEVIVPATTYVATALAIKHVGAKPVFADIDITTLTLDPNSCERMITKKTKAIIFVHLFGITGNILKIKNICNRYDLVLIEDCAQSFGSTRNGKYCGSFGDFSCFSFFETKAISAGEGGAIVFENKEIKQQARKYRHHGMDVELNNRIVDTLGYNFKPSEFESAIICAQLKHFNEILSLRNKHIDSIKKSLGYKYSYQNIDEDEVPVIDKLCVMFKDNKEREILMESRFGSRFFCYLKRPLYKEPIFLKDKSDNCMVSEFFCKHHLVIQISPYFTE